MGNYERHERVAFFPICTIILENKAHVLGIKSLALEVYVAIWRNFENIGR